MVFFIGDALSSLAFFYYKNVSSIYLSSGCRLICIQLLPFYLTSEWLKAKKDCESFRKRYFELISILIVRYYRGLVPI
ncbi:MAG TPA: hypothetical protein PK079_02950 [Leptospiraceae bacterium]|nr:hypothetical protein [Leptospiraceae bacterium]HMX31109.1 hypothetical protein [Leptospiraceae bacterium]HMY30637.1 hypothetical protein [Leptospiraceae bacterium]HMZ64421.1 hypothetical protein [Leptospiraceae bacterium]HNA06185.1 hypothetical protein [Leptospiraceae bacterium]